MKAIILAAGLGTRLRPLTDDIPKPLVPVANTPNIIHIINLLKKYGICDISINLHYRPEPIKELLKDGAALGVNIKYSMESEILGTGGGIKKMLKENTPDTTVIINGDALFMPGIDRILDLHKKSGAIATMVVKKSSDASKKGAVGVDENNIIKRLVYAGDQSMQNIFMFTGMHIVEPEITELLPDNGCIVRQTYIPMVQNSSSKLLAAEETGTFFDLGTPADYIEANILAAKNILKLPVAPDISDESIIGQNVKTGKGCKIINSVIGNNVIISDNVTIKNCVIIENAKVLSSITDAVVLKDGQLMNKE